MDWKHYGKDVFFSERVEFPGNLPTSVFPRNAWRSRNREASANSLVRLANGRWQFRIVGAPNQLVEIQASDDLAGWTPLAA